MIVVGALVEVRPFWAERVRAAMTEIPGVEVHGLAPDGRLILTVRDGHGARPGRSLQAVKDLEGVVSVALIADRLGQEPSVDTDPSVAANARAGGTR